MLFKELGLSAELLRAVQEQGYTQATPIQAQAIPTILSGKDLLAGAQTGTGKTAGFTLPMLQRLSTTTASHSKPRALVLTPTRELAAQVSESVSNYSKYLSLKQTVVFGGVKIGPQVAKLRKGVDIVVATPGRLLDHVSQGTIDLSGIEVLVLDEADRMLDMGFINDIRKIMQRIPRKRQTLLFSATFSNEIKALANSLLNNPGLIEVARRNTANETVKQLIHPVDTTRKRELLSFLIGSNNWKQVLVFSRTKHGANRLATQLEQDGIRSAAIHGNKSQGARTRALDEFKRGQVRVLVATDIAARGIDIDQLPHVINYDLPDKAEDYVHRIGRTGRAGNNGEALSLVSIDERRLLSDIERLIKREIPQEVIEGFEPDKSIKAQPIQRGRKGNPSKGKLAAKSRAKRPPAHIMAKAGRGPRNERSRSRAG